MHENSSNPFILYLPTATTVYQCGENEVPADCWTEYDYCQEGCSVYARNASCETTIEKSDCDDHTCKCKDGHRRYESK